MPGTADTTAVALRDQARLAGLADPPRVPAIAPDPPTPDPARNASAYCPPPLKDWQWQAIDPIRPLPRPTLFQRLFNWLYEYNRY